MNLRRWLVMLMLLAMACLARGRTIYVDDDAPADFNNIQAAIDDANDGDTIVVADGTYTGNGNRDIDFLGKGITLRSENGPENCIIDCNGTEAEPHRGFYFGSGEGPNSVVCGLTIVNGYGPSEGRWGDDGGTSRHSRGGAVCCSCASPTISGCVLTGNVAKYGGAIWCELSSARIVQCELTGNMAHSHGGAIDIWEGCPVISQCLLSENSAGDEGGAISYGGNQDPTISYCTISRNSASMGGGVLVFCGSRTTRAEIAHCIISGNRVDYRYYGGGIQLMGAGHTRESTKNGSITNCVVTGNSTGIAVQGGNWTIQNCTIAANRYTGIWYDASNNSVLANTILWDNALQLRIDCFVIGGPASAYVIVSHSNVEGGLGGVEICPGGCTLDWADGNMDVDPCFADPGYWEPNGTPDQSDDDFWVAGDYRLKSQAGRWDLRTAGWVQDDVMSPCIDAGDMSGAIGVEPFPNGGIINMGAYGGTGEASKSYFGEPVCETIVAGDINGDCKVDLADFAIMAFHWLEEGGGGG